MLFSMIEKHQNAMLDLEFVAPHKTYHGDWTIPEISKWINANKLPFFFEINSRSYAYLSKFSRPVMVLFLENANA